MLLKVKSLNLAAGRPVAILHANTARTLAVYVGERIKIKNKGEIIAIVDIAKGILKEHEIAISAEVMQELHLVEGYAVDVSVAPKPRSISYITEKLNGKELNYEKLYKIVSDIVNNSLNESEIAYLVSGIYIHGMSVNETANLTKAMVATGKQLKLKQKTVDKHGCGGVAGNRTTPIIVSICASAGLIMPKTSSRAITSAAGTADVMECIANVEFSIEGIKKIIAKTNACLVWGGALGLAPADDKIIQVERLLSLDPEAQLIASILAKKLAVNASYVLLDIPYGKTAKVTEQEALKLGKKFSAIAKIFKLKVKPLLSDGSQPIGNGIGPVLEARDVLAVLNRSESRPLDLELKALKLSAELLEFTGKAKKGKGMQFAKQILESKAAYKKFKEIIEAQGGSLASIEKKLQPAKLSFDVKAEKKGIVEEISNKGIAALARAAGCPSDKAAGCYLHVHVSKKVQKGDLLITIYAETEDKLGYAKKIYQELQPIKLK